MAISHSWGGKTIASKRRITASVHSSWRALWSSSRALAEAAVVPSPDPLRFAVAKAFIILSNGYEPDEHVARELFAFIRTRLAPFKRIRKIRRAELRKMEQHPNPVERRSREFFDENFL